MSNKMSINNNTEEQTRINDDRDDQGYKTVSGRDNRARSVNNNRHNYSYRTDRNSTTHVRYDRHQHTNRHNSNHNNRETNNENIENLKNEQVDEELEGIKNTVDELPETIQNFDDMPFLSDELFRGIHEYGFKKPSQIQSKTIHIINNGNDLIAQSQSGSGKTGAFAIGALSRVEQHKHYPQIIVVANTRLLASQIKKVIENVSKYMNINVSLCIGGNHRENSSVDNIRKSHVLVGTPGRLSDIMQNRIINSRAIKTLILDETDVLLMDNFIQQIKDIVNPLNKNTQICIFSATFTKETLKITEQFLRNPYRVTIEKEKINVEEIMQFKIELGDERCKFPTLLDLFGKISFNQMIIFVNSQKSAEHLQRKLDHENIQVGIVHGRMDSETREGILKEFRLSYIKVLVTTDIICRGIDIDDLRIVINYDIPDDPDTYIHRVGRSGRYGSQGVAISFSTRNDIYKTNQLCRDYKIRIEDMPNPDDINEIINGMKSPSDKVKSSKNYN